MSNKHVYFCNYNAKLPRKSRRNHYHYRYKGTCYTENVTLQLKVHVTFTYIHYDLNIENNYSNF